MKYKKITLSEDEIIIPKNIVKKFIYLISGLFVFFFLIIGNGMKYFEYRVSKKMMNPTRIESYNKIIPEKLTLKEKKTIIHYATSESSKRVEALIYYGNIIKKLQEELNNGNLEAKKQLEEWESLLK